MEFSLAHPAALILRLVQAGCGGISHRYCQPIHRRDNYAYAFVHTIGDSTGRSFFLPALKRQGFQTYRRFSMTGFINLYKPIGVTSHDCVAKIRKLLRIKKVGHGGTLDPAATGVLPIGVGKATRLLSYLSHDKAYRATVQFGIATTSDDLEGEIVTQTPVPDVDLATIKAILPKFQGTIQQIPPKYSAIQVGGKRLYELARAGKDVEVPLRTVEVYNIEILNWEPGKYPKLEIAIACGSGTYVRSIARDLGMAANTVATLAGLERTQSSGFHFDSSITLSEMESQIERGVFQLLPPDFPLCHLPLLHLDMEKARRWCNGQRFADTSSQLVAKDVEAITMRTYDEEERFLGISQIIANRDRQQFIIPKVVLG
jgi:tRNA pseudouridine55 synthase